MLKITCSCCKKSQETKPTPKGKARLPRGWKEHQGQTYCPTCWKERYRLRAVTFPVASVLDGTWEEFRAALAAAWGQSTRLANWAVTELAKADIERKPADTKLAPMPTISLYQRWQQHYERDAWTGAAQSANAILHAVELKYRRQRLDVIWRGAAVLPRQRYPVPYPVHNAAWQATYTEYAGTDGQTSRVPTVSVPLGGRRWTLRLRGGRERARQLASFRQIVSGEAVQGELALYRVRASQGSHRPTMQDRAPGGGARVSYRIMVKLVAWLPQPVAEPIQIPPPPGMSIEEQLATVQRRGRKGVLEVRTGRNCLFVAVAPEREQPWLLHADHVRRWITRHRVQLDRIADDTKAERRRPRREKRQLLDRLDVLTHRQHCRLDTWYHTAARQLVNWAVRCNVAELRYDDSEKRYVGEYGWFKQAQLIEQKCDEENLRYVHVEAAPDASGKVVETAEPTDQPEIVEGIGVPRNSAPTPSREEANT